MKISTKTTVEFSKEQINQIIEDYLDAQGYKCVSPVNFVFESSLNHYAEEPIAEITRAFVNVECKQ